MSGGDESADVEAEVGCEVLGLFWFCRETRKDLGDIIVGGNQQFRSD